MIHFIRVASVLAPTLQLATAWLVLTKPTYPMGVYDCGGVSGYGWEALSLTWSVIPLRVFFCESQAV